MEHDLTEPTIASRLEAYAEKLGDRSCRVCNGLGIVFDPLGGGRKTGDFALCRCLEAIVKAPDPPYEYYDEAKNCIVPCPARPARQAIERIRVLSAQSRIPPRYLGNYLAVGLDQADKEGDESTLMALDNAIETITSFGRGEAYGLFIHGPTGAGKTHLACIVLNEIIRLYRKQVLFAKVHRDVLSRVKATFNVNSDLYGEGRRIEEELAAIPALVIDDLGVKTMTEFESQLIYDIIDSRYDYNRLTIITSNDPIDSFREISQGRVTSRLREMCREIHLDVADHRLRHAL